MDFVKAFLVIPVTEEGLLKGHETLYPQYLVLTEPLFGILEIIQGS
jgi:hypothetical protein